MKAIEELKKADAFINSLAERKQVLEAEQAELEQIMAQDPEQRSKLFTSGVATKSVEQIEESAASGVETYSDRHVRIRKIVWRLTQAINQAVHDRFPIARRVARDIIASPKGDDYRTTVLRFKNQIGDALASLEALRKAERELYLATSALDADALHSISEDAEFNVRRLVEDAGRVLAFHAPQQAEKRAA